MGLPCAFFAKIGLDLGFLIFLALVFSSTIFTYMQTLKASLTSIYFSNGYLTIDISAFPLEDCDDYFYEDVCKRISHIIYAGTFYIIFSGLSVILLILGAGSFLAAYCGVESRFFRLKCYHFVYPLVYTIGFAGYLLISGYYSLSDFGLGHEYGSNSGAGLYLMYICETMAVLSLFFYIYSNSSNCICDTEKSLLDN
ncbi:hypothetical protein SteCoe_23299 [Stentor coeruleus]|uniref:Uncharacterized protein n=1 Tax=Stentor coeruleus TaxID=5963 RepID=A0A1R2BK73_9CILI|nr:hypothetical protein SteCoe_23299 [Stentor coeruleus]